MNRRIGLIVIAVVLAIIGTGAVYLYAKGADDRAVKGVQATKVLIVQKRIPNGTAWKDVQAGDFVKQDTLPASSAPGTPISDLKADIPATDVVSFDIAPGQVLTRQMFGAKAPTVGVLSIPDKLQAVTITIPADADVAKFVQAGSQVAVYATFSTNAPAPGGAKTTGSSNVTKLLLPRASVLAVNSVAVQQTNGQGADSGGSVMVTLALPQADVERVILAQSTGKIYFALLSANSQSAEDGGTISFGIFDPIPLFQR